MMGRCYPIAVVFFCLATLCQVALAADTPELAQWLPAESYSGGKQYDARLDRPVKLWGAGIPVKKAFAEITAQTGVDVTCYPAGDVNERVCLNAYLSPDAPPDLRSVLTQISWVMDCAITVSGEGEGPDVPPGRVGLGHGLGQSPIFHSSEGPTGDPGEPANDAMRPAKGRHDNGHLHASGSEDSFLC
jgi:hypothetical protein